MNGVLATTMIGITGGGVITLLAVFVRMMGQRFDRLEDRFDRLEDKVDNNAVAIKDLEIRLTDKFTAALKAMDDKFTAALKALDDKFTGQFKEHGERLARIEVKLENDPNAEAA